MLYKVKESCSFITKIMENQKIIIFGHTFGFGHSPNKGKEFSYHLGGVIKDLFFWATLYNERIYRNYVKKCIKTFLIKFSIFL